jgi:hypothetical protein
MGKLLYSGCILVLVLVFGSCRYDKADLLYPPPNIVTCDTIQPVSYNLKIIPLFQQSCNPCHTPASPDAGVILGVYANDRVRGLNGLLFGVINHSPGYFFMPKGKPKLTDCQIAIVRKWIEAGCPNN